MTPPPWQDDIETLLAGDAKKKPRDLVRAVNGLDEDHGLTDALLADYIESHSLNDSTMNLLHRALLAWDDQNPAPWAAATAEEAAPHTPERRAAIYAKLGFSDRIAERLNALCPVVEHRDVVISKRFEPWYDAQRSTGNDFYWKHYEQYLARKGWGADVIASLDIASTDVVRRLSDPARHEAKKTRGLVIGYVQSGKTANFTGVIAKAIDAGYRLVIVLTGTVEMLRAQTQRRLDRELVGRENLTFGMDMTGEAWLNEFDYTGDKDWDGDGFVSHGDIDSVPGVPRIIRATTLGKDYQRIKSELSKLQYRAANRALPLNHPENLSSIDAYLAVVKKNGTTLKKLLQDLGSLKQGRLLNEVPILIIDDESDQASLDTTSPRRKATIADEGKRRTAINRAISQLLKMAPRAQYVGYTATPFANVFVDPTDEQDIFPSDFLVTLPRPSGYMGVADFHDLERDWSVEERTVATSNRDAFVREIEADLDAADLEAETLRAIDAFVLSGAIKLFRTERGVSGIDLHHTMLVHESVKKALHEDTAQRVRSVWSGNSVTSAAGLDRLRALWDGDFARVCSARADGLPVPRDFDEIAPYVGQAHARVMADNDPVLVVNSDSDLDRYRKKLDFDAQAVWRILVGGTKLSRGFTVEGLTISYFRRSTGQGDTLMQAGRWFGYRKGYRDLVRLFIPSDIYEAFEAVLRDEEAFREELEKYEGFNEDGEPLLTPQAIPPLIAQHLPTVKLTARSKMWNAEITEQGIAGTIRDLYSVPDRNAVQLKNTNFHLVADLLNLTGNELHLSRDRNAFAARTALVTNDQVLGLLNGYRWHPETVDQLRPQVRFFQNICRQHRVDRWAVIWPQVGEGGSPTVAGLAVPARLVNRERRRNRKDFSGSDAKHRKPTENIVNATVDVEPEFQAAHSLSARPDEVLGAILVYLVWDPAGADAPERAGGAAEPEDITALISMVVPNAAVPDRGRILLWRRRQDDDLAAIDTP